MVVNYLQCIVNWVVLWHSFWGGDGNHLTQSRNIASISTSKLEATGSVVTSTSERVITLGVANAIT